MTRRLAATLALLLASAPGGAAAAAGSGTAAGETVPFVGCASDGQTGPNPAPTAGMVPSPVSAAAAQQLAYYASYDLGILAPRGWNCFSVSGSSGSTLVVTPERLAYEDIAARGEGRPGAGVVISVSFGGTSGRFGVADAIARVFPTQRAFAERVVSQGLMDELPTGPYPDDWLRWRNSMEVEYLTPAGAMGLGTVGTLAPSREPVRGLLFLTSSDEMDLVKVSVRLPSAQSYFTDEILETARRTRGASGAAR